MGEALQLLDEMSEREDGVRFRWVWLDAPAGDRCAPALPAAEIEELSAGHRGVPDRAQGRQERALPRTAPVGVEPERVGAIEISESLEEEEAYVQASVVNTVATIITLAALSGLLAMTFGQVLVGRPTRRLVDKARRIGEGDLGGPLLLPQRDELGADRPRDQRDVRAPGRGRASARAARRPRASRRWSSSGTRIGSPPWASWRRGSRTSSARRSTAVGGRAKMIARGLPQEEAAESARIIAEQADRMTKIIRQLLDFARRVAQKASADLRASRARRWRCWSPSPEAGA